MITIPVRQITHSTPRTRILNLDLRGAEFSFAAGQAVMLGLSGSPLRKPYSIASAPWEVRKSGIMQVLVQIDSGALDPHLELAAPGTPVDLEGPFGSFGLPSGNDRPMLFIAGGTGIAPLRSMLIEHLSRPTTQPVSLIYSARSIEEFAFRAELTALEAAKRITLYFTITREERTDWTGRRGRISAELLNEALPAADAICLLCGPPQLVSDASVLLAKLGVREDRILTERY
ncbi:MAG TPA: FAD-binding oxidoreductase [Vicinamibacterales bacterium]